MKKVLVVALFFSSCSPNSLEDFQREGEGITRSIITLLEDVSCRQELQVVLPELEKKFESLVDLMIEARTYQLTHPEDESLYESFTSEHLRKELQRVYALEGGREAIEKAQHEALLRLDAFERNIAKQNELRRK